MFSISQGVARLSAQALYPVGAAGRLFTELLQRGFAEGQTAPGVTVEYRPCKALAATRWAWQIDESRRW
ncbi:MAG: hypothetical protein K9J74_12100 [Sulfuritalea sp.]|nr:hypothetical protein [Sulfuritalea sp.]